MNAMGRNRLRRDQDGWRARLESARCDRRDDERLSLVCEADNGNESDGRQPRGLGRHGESDAAGGRTTIAVPMMSMVRSRAGLNVGMADDGLKPGNAEVTEVGAVAIGRDEGKAGCDRARADHRIESNGARQKGRDQERSDEQSLPPNRRDPCCAKPMHAGFLPSRAGKGKRASAD